MTALVTAAELRHLLDAPDVAVLDATVELPPPRHDGDARAVSGADAFAGGHIPGARHADLLGALARHDLPGHFAHPAPATLADGLRRLGVGRRTRVVAYDAGDGIWAARLWWMLRALALPAVRVLDGGLAAWRAAGGALETGPAATPATAARLGPRRPVPRLWADRDDVAEVVAGRRHAQLVCALTPEVFAGSAPTRYSRRGHIPGSVNAPARGLVGDDGRLLGHGRLATALAPLLADPRPVIVYCGGGISACVVALGLHLLGRDDVTVYDGSLEEWSADPALPLSVGA